MSRGYPCCAFGYQPTYSLNKFVRQQIPLEVATIELGLIDGLIIYVRISVIPLLSHQENILVDRFVHTEVAENFGHIFGD